MPRALLIALSELGALALALAGRATAPEPETDYLELLERNTHIIYPALAILVVALLVLGILEAWRSQDLHGLQKVELKRELILELRRQLGGASAETLAKAIGLESFKTVKLLEELQRDGIVISHTTSARLTTWRIKGVGPVPSGPTGVHPPRTA
ncbi:MAG TPA: hypothetical protein VFB81_03140, partial [Myxococcales bacterium]|nr:hypothetical protein [Myxococcales bacterium]